MKTFAYLDGLREWPPRGLVKSSTPDSEPVQPDQEPILRVDIVDGQMDLLPSVSSADPNDRVALKALNQLRAAVEKLALAAGNMHFGIANDARTFAAMLENDIGELDMIDVYDFLERMRDILEGRGERRGEDVLSADEVQALKEIGRAGPSLVLPDPEVQIAMQRQDEYYAQTLVADVAHAQETLSTTIREADNLFGERLREFQRDAGTVRNTVTRWITVKNTAIAVLSAVALGGAGAMGTDLYTLAVSWVSANSAAIQSVMGSIGESAAVWSTPILNDSKKLTDAAKAKVN